MATLRSMTHAGCTQSLREDLAVGLIYGPYAEKRTDVPPEVCSVCKGKGTYANYTQDTQNRELAGKPAPCEFCQGKGTRAVLRFMTMAEWAKRTGLCVYCGTPRRH